MSLFGFFDVGTSQSVAKVSAFGSTSTARSGQPLAHTPGADCALWCNQTLASTDVIVGLRGAPLWRGSANAQCKTADLSSILDAYRQRGAAFLGELAGRFALVILDHGSRRALLAVDPMGIERLTYAVVDRSLIFGTSAEQVAQCPIVLAKVDDQAVFDYLMMHMVPAPLTIYSTVKKLRPATCAVFENGQPRIERYWTPSFASDAGSSTENFQSSVFTSLRSAVRDCGIDDSTGAFLSGGLDSSTVAGLLSEVGPQPAKTFSIGFGYADYDELSYARIANRRFGCTGFEHTVHGNDIVESFAAIARAYDEPFGNSSALPAYYCARLAKQNGVNHLLAGDGGDELFGGNSRYVEQQVFERYQTVPRFFRKGILEGLIGHWPRGLDFWLVRKARGYIEKANIPLPARLETWNILQRLGTAVILHEDFLHRIDVNAPLRRMQEVWDSTPSDSLLSHMLYYDWHYTLADNDLRKVETMCEMADVKVSYPMLHPAVVDMSTRLPPKIMMPDEKLRHFYKQAVQGFIPDEIIHKKKHGFGLPFGLWLQESEKLREMIYGNISALRQRRIISGEFIDRLLKLHGTDDARYYGVFLWVLAMLEQWFQEHKAP